MDDTGRLPDLVAQVLDRADRHGYRTLEPEAGQALALAAMAGCAASAVRVHAAASLVCYRSNDMDGATRHAAAARRLGLDGGLPAPRAEGLIAWARIEWSVGDLDEALRHLDEARAPALGHGDARIRVHLHNLLGLVLADLGELDRSLAEHEAAREAARGAGVPDLDLVADTNLAGRWLTIGERHRLAGEHAAARQAWRTGLDGALAGEARARAHALEHGLPHLLASQGAMLWRLGRIDEALQAFERQRAVVERTPDRTSLLRSALHLAELHRGQGRPDQARRLLDEALAEADRLQSRARAADLHRLASALHEEDGRLAEALAHFKRFHALTAECAVDRARRKAMAMAVRLDTERALADAEAQRRRACDLADAHARLQAQADRWRQEARIDPLTGLANRRTLDAEAARLHARARADGRPMGVILMDLDHFKAINDSHSHAVGDAVLRRLGELLRAQARPADLVARYGGEEFAVLLPDTSPEMARCVGRGLCDAVRAADWAALRPGLRVTVSIGLADAAAQPSVADAFALADRGLYCAKREGRDRVREAVG